MIQHKFYRCNNKFQVLFYLNDKERWWLVFIQTCTVESPFLWDSSNAYQSHKAEKIGSWQHKISDVLLCDIKQMICPEKH